MILAAVISEFISMSFKNIAELETQYPLSRREELSDHRKKVRKQRALKQIAVDKEAIREQLNFRNANFSPQPCDRLVEKSLPRHPFDLIHEEGVWEEILSYLIDFEDVKNAYHSCTLFHELLERKVVNHLFPQVLSILQKRNYLSYYKASEKTAILALRCTSKSWKKAVNHAYFEEMFHPQDWHVRHSTNSPIINSITSKQKLDKMISSLTESHTLFTRQLLIVDPIIHDENEWNDMFVRTLDLLERCGDSIWSLVYQTRRSFSAAYLTVREWCSLLPNLKVLSVTNLRGFNHEYAYIDEIVRSEIVLLLETLRTNPFPTMASLQHYKEHDMPCSFSAEILSRNSGIKSVEVSEINFEIGQAITAMRLDRLSLYRFHHQTSTYFISNPWRNPYYWPLKRISLQNERGAIQCKTSSLFQFLQNYKNSLEDLNVDLDLEEMSVNVYLEVPKLKYLRWRLCSRRRTSFMAPLEILESLSLIIDNIHEVIESEKCIRLKGHSATDFQFISWKEFPSLQKIMLEDFHGIVRRTYLRP